MLRDGQDAGVYASLMRVRDWWWFALGVDIMFGLGSLVFGCLAWLIHEPDEDGLGGLPTVVWKLPMVAGIAALLLAAVAVGWWLVREITRDDPLEPITLDSGW